MLQVKDVSCPCLQCFFFPLTFSKTKQRSKNLFAPHSRLSIYSLTVIVMSSRVKDNLIVWPKASACIVICQIVSTSRHETMPGESIMQPSMIGDMQSSEAHRLAEDSRWHRSLQCKTLRTSGDPHQEPESLSSYLFSNPKSTHQRRSSLLTGVGNPKK